MKNRPSIPWYPHIRVPALTSLMLWLCLCATGGCTWMSYIGTDDTGAEFGKTYFVGGAGPIGSAVGVTTVPEGLRRAGYRGAIETFGWQSVVGGTLRDQTDRARNEEEARRLARRIQDYLDKHPGRRVNIIALSAGTGIATWALESLDQDCHVGTVVFMASSLSRRYDLSRALGAIDGELHNFFSANDQVLRYGLPITGSIDRQQSWPSAAGLYGFTASARTSHEDRLLYLQKLFNHPYRLSYRRYGNYGQHTDGASEKFIRRVIAPLLSEPLPQRD